MQHAIGVHGYVFVYSITSIQSFEVIQTVYDKLCHVSGVPEIPCVIVGSKSDLRSSYVALVLPDMLTRHDLAEK